MSSPCFLTASILNHPQLVHGFSTRNGGVSPVPFDSLNLGGQVGDDPARVADNQRRFQEALGVPTFQCATVKQVHGKGVVRVSAGSTGAVEVAEEEGDALVTDVPGWLVGVRTADCVPLLLCGTGSQGQPVVAAVHAGWRGTTLCIVEKTLEVMVQHYGISLESVRAAIGPSIEGPQYPVGQDVLTALRLALGHDPVELDGVILPPGPFEGQAVARVALKEANRRMLLRAGVLPSQVEVLPGCTVLESGLFFSHRRDAGRTGRMLNVIGIHAPVSGGVNA
ncbi:MAG: peptidoglycan editing factor PgeF [Myxococcota bacterium]